MKKTGWYIAAVTMLAGTLMWATPVVGWAATNDTVELVEGIEDTVSEVIEAGADGPEAEEADAAAEEATVEEVLSVEDQNAAARQNLVNYALQFVGNPYRAGGNDPHTGADCSGFVKYVMQYGAGISMNRSSVSQATQGRQISASQMQPGDLVFYSNGSRINHVAMYIGDGQIVHASTERTGIKISTWNYRSPVKIVSMFG